MAEHDSNVCALGSKASTKKDDRRETEEREERSENNENQMWQHLSDIPAFKRLRQEAYELEANLDYTGSSRLTWDKTLSQNYFFILHFKEKFTAQMEAKVLTATRRRNDFVYQESGKYHCQSRT